MTEDIVASALKVALLFKCDPFAVMERPARQVAEVLARTNQMLDDLAGDDG